MDDKKTEQLQDGIHEVDFCQEKTILTSKNQSLLDAALKSEIPMFNVCGGKAKCSTCRVLILSGFNSLSSPNRKELILKQKMNFPPNVRLACQTFIIGPNVKVDRIIRDEEDIDLYVGRTAGSSTQQIGEEKVLVLFFLDIRNFTSFLESNLAFDVIHVIRKLFLTFHAIIQEFNGKIIETAGDGIYAVFGLNSESLQENVALSIKAGRAILSKVKAQNRNYFQKFFSFKIELGIGIHQGAVICGSISLGGETRMIIMGLPVNVASRIQNATKELDNDFIISSVAFNLLNTKGSFNPITSIFLKGVQEPIEVHLLGKSYEKNRTENHYTEISQCLKIEINQSLVTAPKKESSYQRLLATSAKLHRSRNASKN